MIPLDIIDKVKQRIDIIEVIEDFITLKKAGASYKALSPFTDEKTASFVVSPSKGIFKDFSSGKGGDAIAFVMEHENLSYIEAIKYLGKKYGVEITEEEPSEEELLAQTRRESLHIVIDFAAEVFQKNLLEIDEGLAIGLTYFKERKFSNETIELFRLGYSLKSRTALLQTAIKKGYNIDLLMEAGLVGRAEKNLSEYDRFNERVIFPIHNISGKIIAFAGRTLSNREKLAKYINSPETELYHKSKELYGLYFAKNDIRKLDNCYIVEGYTDVISMHQIGIKNVVASSGTSLTVEQVKLIRRFSKNVTVLFDGDKAGVKASMRGIDILLEAEINVKVVSLPDNQDPDGLIDALGTTAFRDFLEQETDDFIQYKIKLLLKEAGNDPIKKTVVIREIVQTLSKINDPILNSLYIKNSAQLLDIDEHILIKEQNKIKLHLRKKNAKEIDTPLLVEDIISTQKKTGMSPELNKIIEEQEKETVRLLLNYGNHHLHNSKDEQQSVMSFIFNEIKELAFTNSTYKTIVEILKEKYVAGEEIDVAYFLEFPDESIKNTAATLLATKYETSELWESKHEIPIPYEKDYLKKSILNNIHRFKLRFVQRIIEEKIKEGKRLSPNEKEENFLLEEIYKYKKIEENIAKEIGNVTIR